jgi:hypothetical protein
MASATLPAVATQPLPTVDCGSTVEFGLETVDRGDEVLVRLSAKGADTCTLQGQVLLWLIRPVVDPGPDYPPEANVTRQMKLLIDFPFDGVIGEWTWRNWCAEPMPWVIWQAKFSGPNGPTAQLSNDFWPSCTAEGEPTWATRELFVNGLEGDPTPDSACLRAGYVGWLCEFATTVADKSTRGGTRLFDYPGGPTTESYFLCDGNGSAPGLVNSTLCAGRPANESIPGYWLATPKNADAYVSLADLTAQVTRALATSPQLLAVSCAGGSDCSRFALTFGDANAPAVTLIYRLERGREPALIGAALGSTPSGLSSPFGEFSLEPLGARGN